MIVAARPIPVHDQRHVARRVVATLADLELPSGRADALETAVAEAIANAREHGNLGDGGVVDVEVTRDAAAVRARIGDSGRGGGLPADIEEPDLAAKLRGDQPERGWGLLLMRGLVDQIHSSHVRGRHVVELVLHHEPGTSERTS